MILMASAAILGGCAYPEPYPVYSTAPPPPVVTQRTEYGVVESIECIATATTHRSIWERSWAASRAASSATRSAVGAAIRRRQSPAPSAGQWSATRLKRRTSAIAIAQLSASIQAQRSR
jgi:hypothetical protein